MGIQISALMLQRLSTIQSFSKQYRYHQQRLQKPQNFLKIFTGQLILHLVNELKMLFDKMGIDIWEVIEASKTKPFGFQAFYPGPGLGGHCIPIDPFYLTWKAREYEFRTRFIELAGEINTHMPYYVAERETRVLNKFWKTLNSAKILILGMAYKKDVDDQRESPSLRITQLLRDENAKVIYNDPFVPVCKGHRHYPDIDMKSVEAYGKGFERCRPRAFADGPHRL